MSDELGDMKRQVALGEMAKEFLNGELGVYCMDMAEFEKNSAMIALSKVDPEDRKEIIRLQNMIARHEDFAQWLIDLVAVGELAYEEYSLMNSE